MTDTQHVPTRPARRKPRALRARRVAAALSVASFVTIGSAMAILETPSTTQVASRVASKATTVVATNSSSTGSSTTATTTPAASSSSTRSSTTAHTTTKGS